MPVLRALLRWIAAALVGVLVTILCAVTPDGGLFALPYVAGPLVVIPLVLARRRPRVAAWLAPVMLAAAPLAWMMTLGMVDEPLVAYDRCGTMEGIMWVFGVPFMATVLALAGAGLWRARRAVAGAWRPAGVFVLLAATVLLGLGGVRMLGHGTIDSRADLLARAEAFELAPAAAGSRTTTTIAGLAVQRTCDEATCEVHLGVPGREIVEEPFVRLRLPVEAPLTVYAFEHLRIVQGPLPSPEAAFDLERGRTGSISLHDVAAWSGPPAAAVGLLLLAALGVAASMTVGTTGPLVWRRLGARRVPEDATAEEVLALRSTHLAVVVVAAIPLLACAWIGLL